MPRVAKHRHNRQLRPNTFGVVTLLLAALVLPRIAGAAYVIDRLLVAIHKDRTPESAVIQVIPTGSPIEVLTVDAGFAQVDIGEGITGWVDASYITEDKPARMLLAELEAQMTLRTEALEKTRATVETLRAEIVELRSANDSAPNDPSGEPRQGPKDSERESTAAKELQALTLELEQVVAQNRVLQEEATLRELAARQDAAAEIQALRTELRAQRVAQPASGVPSISSTDLRELQTLAEENQRLKGKIGAMERPGASPASTPAPGAMATWFWSVETATWWELAMLGFAVVLAFFVGAWWVETSARRRLGGFRL